MTTNIDSRRLDELIKQTLSNYEVSSDTSDWQKMESMLDAAPKSGTDIYKQKLTFLTDSVSQPGILKKLTASYIFIAVLMLAGGGYLLYTILKSPKAPENIANSTSTTDSLANITTEEPSAASTTAIESQGIQPKDSISPPPAIMEKTIEKVVEKKEITDKKQPVPAEKNDKKTEKAVPEITKVNDKKPENKKEVVKSTDKPARPAGGKEKDKPVVKTEDKTSQDAPKKPDTSVESGNFTPLPIKADSVKKQPVQQPQQPQQPEQQKDSIKTP